NLIDENNEAILFQASQRADEAEIGHGERLPRGKDDHAHVRCFQILPRDFISNEEGVVDARRIEQDCWKAEGAQIEKDIGKLGDIRILAFAPCGRALSMRIACSDIAVEEPKLNGRKDVLGSQQFLKTGAELAPGPRLHILDLPVEGLPVEVREQALGK